MVIGILCIMFGLGVLLIGKVGDAFHEPFPPFEDDQEFWDYFTKLSAITDPMERRAFEQKKKREMLARKRAKERNNE